MSYPQPDSYGEPVPVVHLPFSALAGGPADISVRISGRISPGGPATVVFLHGGWGHEFYPLDAAALAPVRVVIPDRSGYGGSTPITALPPDFHRLAMHETAAVLDALGIDRAVWWGHSDGAVIAALAGLEIPHRTAAVVLEALHYTAAKPGSRAFFELMAGDPDAFGPQISARLAAEHGDDRWRQVLRLDGRAWLDLAAAGDLDLYDGRLGTLVPPTLIIHGGQDPRTEPGELAAITAALPRAGRSLHPQGRHSPHSERSVRRQVLADAAAFVRSLAD